MDEKDSICTGVTAILPHEQNPFLHKVPAASFVLNGFGKTVGLIQLEELGLMESPIMLTNTFGVG
ncbi:P1 family peptidase, partial [Leptospira santarosai]|nr:P1 family peptidase [Leptospira santarosai]